MMKKESKITMNNCEHELNIFYIIIIRREVGMHFVYNELIL